MEGLTGWVISSIPEPPPRQHKHERRYTPSTHTFILKSWIWKDDCEGQMIFEDLVGLKLWHLSYRWGKTPRKPHPGNLSRPGIEPGRAAWQERMLPSASQLWISYIYLHIKFKILRSNLDALKIRLGLGCIVILPTITVLTHLGSQQRN